MSSLRTRGSMPASGCLLWLLLFGVLFSCLCSSATFIGGLAASLRADAVANIVDDYLCPDGSVGEIITYQVIPRRNATDYEMQCVAPGGKIVREPDPDYAFYWLGGLAVAAMLVAALVAFFLMIPFEVWRSRRNLNPPS